MQKDFRINVKVTNANIQRSIEGMGYRSLPKWAAEFHYPYATLMQFISLKKSPLSVDGDPLPSALALCALLGESFDGLFSEHQRDALATNRASVDVSFDEVAATLASDGSELLDHVYKAQQSTLLDSCVRTLSRREEFVVRQRYGWGDAGEKTQSVIGEDLGVSKQQVSLIEATALRRLSKRLSEFCDPVDCFA